MPFPDSKVPGVPQELLTRWLLSSWIGANHDSDHPTMSLLCAPSSGPLKRSTFPTRPCYVSLQVDKPGSYMHPTIAMSVPQPKIIKLLKTDFFNFFERGNYFCSSIVSFSSITL